MDALADTLRRCCRDLATLVARALRAAERELLPAATPGWQQHLAAIDAVRTR